MTKKSLHLALLVCDTPLPEVVEKYGDYTKQYALVFNKAASNKDLAITWEFFDVVDAQEYPSLQEIKNKKYDAIVVTGSKHNAHDNTPWILKLVDFLQTVQKEPYTQAVKLVGICFGHQAILRAAGGTTERNPKGWEVGYTEIELNSSGKGFFKTEKTKLVSEKNWFCDYTLVTICI
jgi:GMP synthase-like glutamine amidotransferase